MGYQAVDFLAGLFDGDPPAVSGLAGRQPMPEAVVQAPVSVGTDLTAGPKA